SSTDVWAVGEYYSKGWKTLTENWNGKTWTLVNRPNVLVSNETNAVAVLPDGSAWTGGEYAPKGGYPQGVTERLCPDLVSNSGFAVPDVSAPLGISVSWLADPSDQGTHTVTDGSGMGLFDSGSMGPSAPFAWTPPGSGTYSFIDGQTGHTGAVSVSMTA